MLSHSLYQRLQSTIQQADDIFKQYEKYSHCFSIRSVDEELGSLYRLINLSYTKLSMHIQVNEPVSNISENQTINAIDNTEVLMANSNVIFRHMQAYLQANRWDIINTLRNHQETANILTELNKLESHTEQAEKIVGRVKKMLLGSQQIYSGNGADRRIA